MRPRRWPPKYAESVYAPKDAGLVVVLATHVDPSKGGRNIESAAAVTGVFLDRDMRGSDPRPASRLLQSFGVAHVVAWKPSGKWHLYLQLRAIEVQRKEDGAVDREWYGKHRSRLRHLIDSLGLIVYDEDREIEGRAASMTEDQRETLRYGFDVSIANGLMHPCFGLHRRSDEGPEDQPVTQVWGCDGIPLDLERFADLTGCAYEVHRPAAKIEPLPNEDARTTNQILDELRRKLRAYRKRPTVAAAIARMLDGKDIIDRAADPRAQREPLIRDIAAIIAMMEPYAEPAVLCEVAAKSVASTKGSKWDLGTWEMKIARAQDYARTQRPRASRAVSTSKLYEALTKGAARM